MALPPEQINIKRRREEEPVETLYIQSELHQTKRRFTDFVFQRVQIRGKDGGGGGGAASGDGDDDDASASASSPASGVPQPTRQRVLRTPRSVSSLKVAKGGGRNVAGVSGSAPSAPPPPPPPPGASGGGGGVPLVRATSPGAEIREEKRLAALRREKEEKIRRAVYSSQSPPRAESSVPSRNENASSAAGAAGESGRSSPASISSSGKPPIRRFQISRSSTNTPVNLHRGFDSGIQKRKGVGAGAGGSDGVAVLVEKLRRKPHSRQASMAVDSALQSAGVPAAAAASAESRPRKRPVVNQAERKWREERKNAISTAKKHINDVMDKGAQAQNKGNWDDESDQLAGEFERIALELDDGSQMDETKTPAESTGLAERTGARLSNPPKPSLKYQPRTPNKPRSTERQPTATTQHDDRGGDTETESDGDYVYDVYIRRPLPQSESQSQTQQPQPQPQAAKLKNPLTDLEKQNALGPNVGVIVITQEDESYWNYFIEDDDDDEAWDSEDADSNAENNPANDYPDEELSWDDSDDDDGSNPFARYRQAGFDEDFDFDDSGSEGSFDPGLRRAAYGEYDSDEEW